ncbi:tetratricopeptide repeat-containing diguanylate cyclase [Shewanella mesophila]|uniref:tetratricopeptide repeat-containing diguanylate cyclase n=1 Tax=Shewanella mesophila TaxID=2864208 RepID=UPI0021ACA162|nr:GGDEF domain-containing protein [Shewanella mesophila]
MTNKLKMTKLITRTPKAIYWLLMFFCLNCIPNANAELESTQSNIDTLLQSAEEARTSNPERFNEFMERLDARKSTFNREQKGYFDYLTAYKLSYAGRFDEAISIYTLIIDSKISPSLSFKARLSEVNIYAISKNWNEGLQTLSQLLNSVKEVENIELRERTYAVAAVFYNQIEQFELGLQYAERILATSNNPRTLCLAHNLFLEASLKLKRLEANDRRIDDAKKVCHQGKELMMEGAIYTYVAPLYLESNQSKLAIELLESKLRIIEETKYVPILSQFYSLLSEAYFNENKPIKAEEYALKTLSLASQTGNSKPLINTYYILYQITKSRNDFKSALNYHVKYAQADKAYLDDIKTKHLAFQLAEHQATEQKSRIALLDRQNHLLLTEQKLAKTQAENTRLFISLLIAIITLLGFWAYKSWTIQKRLKQLAEYDALTHVFNRGHFTQVAQSALTYCESTQADLSYILFDLDHFKQINDKYGHACGDWVLKKVAKICQAQGRKNDIFARIGGEEFCIALPGCDLNTAIKLAKACREAIANIDYSKSGHDFQVTASFGITDTKLSGYKLERLFNDADSAMYQSKHGGRNRLYIFDPQAETVIPSTAKTPQSN